MHIWICDCMLCQDEVFKWKLNPLTDLSLRFSCGFNSSWKRQDSSVKIHLSKSQRSYCISEKTELFSANTKSQIKTQEQNIKCPLNSSERAGLNFGSFCLFHPFDTLSTIDQHPAMCNLLMSGHKNKCFSKYFLHSVNSISHTPTRKVGFYKYIFYKFRKGVYMNLVYSIWV